MANLCSLWSHDIASSGDLLLQVTIIDKEDPVVCGSMPPDFQLINGSRQEFVSYPQEKHWIW